MKAVSLVMDFPDSNRVVALFAAIELFSNSGDTFDAESLRDEVVETYTTFLDLLEAAGPTVSILLTAGPITDQKTGQPFISHNEGPNMQIPDNYKVDYVAEPVDSKGAVTGDSLVWASDDNGAVVTLLVSADTHTCTVSGVAPGTANGTVTDNTVTPPLSTPFVVSVVAGGTATLNVAAGTPVPQ